jgi:orotidine-5'-phosphate decarboxylase
VQEAPGARDRDRLAVALDVPTLEEAAALLGALGAAAGWLKVGSELFVAAGPRAVALGVEHGRVFLDLKLHDIPNTVAAAVRAAVALGVSLLTVHAAGGRPMLEAARAAAAEEAARLGRSRPRIVAVTVLTSLDDAMLTAVGVAGGLPSQVARLADLAAAAGLDGVVTSPREVAEMRRRMGPEFFLVCPGIRPAGASADDQSRISTPMEAIAGGADLLVVGRPIVRAPDPAAAARGLVAEIATARSAARG